MLLLRIVKKHIGTTSADGGESSFLVTKNERQDFLSISSLDYNPYKIKQVSVILYGIDLDIGRDDLQYNKFF